MPVEPGPRYKVFPPRWRHLLLPVDSRRAALSTLAMWSPCRPGGLALQRTAWVAVRLVGPRVLPGATQLWERPVAAPTWARLEAVWRELVGDFDVVGIYAQPQAARKGLALLLFRHDRPLAFAKLRPSPADRVHADLQHEHDVLDLLDRADVTAFVHPRPLAVGAEGGWSYLVTTTVGDGLDRPARGPVQPLVDAVADALAGLPRPDDVPPSWSPMHGDLTPWNLRENRRGATTLVDWEDAGWGPAGADAVLLHATRHILFGDPPPALPPDAARFWLDRVGARPPDPQDDRTRQELLAALRLVQAAGA